MKSHFNHFFGINGPKALPIRPRIQGASEGGETFGRGKRFFSGIRFGGEEFRLDGFSKISARGKEKIHAETADESGASRKMFYISPEIRTAFFRGAESEPGTNARDGEAGTPMQAHPR